MNQLEMYNCILIIDSAVYIIIIIIHPPTESSLKAVALTKLPCSKSEKENLKEVNIVLTGKSGAGKSTLICGLLGEEAPIIFSPDLITQEIEIKSIVKHGITIRLVDTPGLIKSEKHKKEQLKEMFKKLGFNLLVYCISVNLSENFEETNPEIIKCLQDTYGSAVWKHCVIVFTFSNFVCSRKPKEYKAYIEEYLGLLQKELAKYNIPEKPKTIFTWAAASKGKLSDEHTILAIPAGNGAEDPVLPGIKLHGDSWLDEIYLEMVHKCSKEKMEVLIQCRHGDDRPDYLKALSVASVVVSSICAGAGVGAVMGSTVGGPVGAAVGALIGGGVGAVVGGIGGYFVAK